MTDAIREDIREAIIATILMKRFAFLKRSPLVCHFCSRTTSLHQRRNYPY